MKALILAAGYATRLYPLTKEYPKPLLAVKGRPIIDFIVDKLNNIPVIDEIYVVTNSKFIRVFRPWAKARKSPKKITLIDDLTKNNRDRLGAIGDIDFVVKRKGVKEDLLVIGGDNLFSGKLKGFLDFFRAHRDAPCIGLYRLRNRKDAVRYGVAKLNRRKAIISFIEKPKKPESNLVAMCLYYMPKDSLGSIKQYLRDNKKQADTTGGYIAWLKNRVDIYGYVFKGSWFDIGDYKYLNAAKEKFI
ncbi:MAG: nucleotidyltransferase family protein [Candidatus Omnitrophota bacterium]